MNNHDILPVILIILLNIIGVMVLSAYALRQRFKKMLDNIHRIQLQKQKLKHQLNESKSLHELQQKLTEDTTQSLLRQTKINQKLEDQIIVLNAELSQTKEELANTDVYLSKNSDYNWEILCHHFKTINSIILRLHENTFETDKNSRIARNLRNEIQGILSDQNLLDFSTNCIDQKFDKAINKIHTHIPNLKENDRIMLILHSCGISSKSLALFFNIDIKTIYSRKKNLKSKIIKKVPDGSIILSNLNF